jgi:hypothetical protein
MNQNPARALRPLYIRVVFVLTLFVYIFVTVCVPLPPKKMPLRVRTVTGIDVGSDPDATVIREGVTTRAEVLRQFANFDTGRKGE